MTTTAHPIGATSVETQAEFVDHKNARRLFSIPRPTLYKWSAEGKIRSVSIRQKGALRGKRLFDCASIREFLRANMAASTEGSGAKEAA